MTAIKNNLPSRSKRSRKSDNPNDYELKNSYKEKKHGDIGGQVRRDIAELSMKIGVTFPIANAIDIKIALQSEEIKNYDYLEVEIAKLEDERLQAMDEFEKRQSALRSQQDGSSLLRVLG